MTQVNQNPELGVGVGGEHNQSPAEQRLTVIRATMELIYTNQLNDAKAALAATIAGETVEG